MLNISISIIDITCENIDTSIDCDDTVGCKILTHALISRQTHRNVAIRQSLRGISFYTQHNTLYSW